MLKLKKVLFVIIAAIFLFLLSSSVYAVSFDDRFGRAVTLPDFNVDGYTTEYGFIVKKYMSKYQLYVFVDDSTVLTVDSSDGKSIYLRSGSLAAFDVVGDDYSYTGTVTGHGSRIGTLSEFIYTTTNFYDDTDRDTVILSSSPNFFFPEAKQEETLGEVSKAVKEVEMEKVLAEVLGVLPVVMIIVVSLLAFWKGLKILYHFLVTS